MTYEPELGLDDLEGVPLDVLAVLRLLIGEALDGPLSPARGDELLALVDEATHRRHVLLEERFGAIARGSRRP